MNTASCADMPIGYTAPVSAELGKRIHDARKRAGLNQAQLGKRLGVQQGAVSKWETGDSSPTGEQLVQIAAVVKCQLDALVSGLSPLYDTFLRTLPVTGPGSHTESRGKDAAELERLRMRLDTLRKTMQRLTNEMHKVLVNDEGAEVRSTRATTTSRPKSRRTGSG
jgi:transcriptional regulator with XRE-family HTH domain